MRSSLRWNRLTNDHRRSARSSSRRVPVSITLKASTAALSWPQTASGSGSGRGSGSSWPGRWPQSASSSSRCAVAEAAWNSGPDRRCRRRGRCFRCVTWRGLSCRRIGRALAAFTGDPLAGGGDGFATRRAAATQRMAAGQLFCFALQSRPAASENRLPLSGPSRRRKIVARRHSKPAQGGGSSA